MTFLTIITVVWNDVKGLQNTAESVLRQTCRDFEWRIVDGLSKDGTLEYAESLRASLPNLVVTSGRDNGIYDGMNKGLREARGEYLLFLNAGDRLAGPEVVERIRQTMADGAADILWGSSLMLFGPKEIWRKAKDPSYIGHGQPGLHQATVYRTALHKKFEYDQSFRVCADYQCLCRMVASGARTLSRDIPISINEFTPRSHSMRFKTKSLKECFAIQRDILQLPLPARLFSAGRRALNSMVAKGLAFALDRSGR